MARIVSSLLTLAIFLACASAALQSQIPQSTMPLAHSHKRLIADYDSNSKFLAPPFTYGAAQIPYHKLTHIIHAGVPFDANGKLQVPGQFVEPELIPRAHAAGTKVVLLIGGDVTGLEANQSAIPALLQNLKAFVTTNDYDGIDLDWEYPQSTQDTAFLLTLMTALRTAFPSPRYTLSIDAAPWTEPSYDVPHLKKVIDWFNIMTYDCAGPWTAHAQLNAPIFWDSTNPAPDECQPGGSDQESAAIFLADAPASQLNQGTPFYGYEYTNITQLYGLCPNAATTFDGACDDTVLTLNYGPNIKQLINRHGWVRHMDETSLVPYLLRKDGSPGFITYDDARSTYIRVLYSDWVQNLGGTFLWSLDADYDGHSQDLLQGMYRASRKEPLDQNLLP